MFQVQSTKTPKDCKDKFKAMRAEAALLKASGQKVSDVSTAGKRAKAAIPEAAYEKQKGKKGKKNHAKAAMKKGLKSKPKEDEEVSIKIKKAKERACIVYMAKHCSYRHSDFD